MTDLTVRKLLIDLTTPFAGRWNGGDAFSSAFFSALSMSFPVGEQYFIDSVREGLKTLPDAEREHIAAEVQGFIGQEATHRRIHALFNNHLAQLGYSNEFERRSIRRLRKNAHHKIHVHVAATAATEHFTALFADWMLRHHQTLAGAEPRLQTLWLWHSAEESEHRSTAFDLYKAMGGNEKVRLGAFRYITVTFLSDVLRQTVRNLWHDKSLFLWSTWRSGARLLFARDGMIRGNFSLWKEYLGPDFHPRRQNAGLAQKWLKDNASQFVVLGQP